MNRRLLRESVLAVDEALRAQSTLCPHSHEYSVYHVVGRGALTKDSAEAVKLMQGLDEFPWPDDRCILIAQHPGAQGFEPASTYMIVRDASTDPLVMVGALCMRHRREVSFDLSRLTRSHLTIDPRWMAKFIDEWFEGGDEHAKKAASWNKSLFQESGHFWRLIRSDKDPVEYGLFEAVTAIAAMSPLVTPTDYLVKVLAGEFGPKPFRRAWKGKPILATIEFDRLFRMAKGHEPSDVDAAVPFHFRRGHIRHLWQKAGIDKTTLPDSALERMRIVQAKKVQRVYVSPAWVGDESFVFDGMDCTIVMGERTLPPL